MRTRKVHGAREYEAKIWSDLCTFFCGFEGQFLILGGEVAIIYFVATELII